MIIDVAKYLILGTEEDLEHFFHLAQENGFLEFISVSPKKVAEAPVTIQSLMAAVKILKKQPLKEPYHGGGDLAFAMQISERILELQGDLEKLGEEKRLLQSEITRVAPFGDFSMDDINYIENIGKRKIQFFCMKESVKHKTNFSDDVLYVGTDYDLDYFIAIEKEQNSYPGMIEMRIDAPLGDLENRHGFVVDAISRFENELKDYASYLEFLKSALVDEMNKYNLQAAKKEISHPLKNTLFAVEAWVPRNKITTLYGLIDGMSIHAEEVHVDEHDRVPTYFKNTPLNTIGEDLVKIYDVPATTDRDPSGWVLWFFALFFAIIVADAGYGLIFLLTAFYIKKKFPRLQGQQKRTLKLFFILSSFCIGWGILTSSYFGMQLSPTNPLTQASLIGYLVDKKAAYTAIMLPHEMITAEVKKEFARNILMEVILMIAIIHVSIAFLRNLKNSIPGLGWIAFMVGGYLYFPSMLKATSLIHFMGWITPSIAAHIGLQLIYVGIVFALVSAIIQKRMKGLGEVANLVQVFADVLSYLRLYALGLAGSIMAETFNNVGASMPIVLDVIVIFLGHSVNILLSLMGGVIHGLRLNFLEWYHYCFDGGGKLFKPLQKIKRS
jgi:V/A-type H+-transporting ATPase subunit I